MKKNIGLLITILIASSLSSESIKRDEAVKYYNEKGVITDKTDNIIYTLDFTALDKAINDKSLQYIQYLSEVEGIHLSGCQVITDEGLKYLSDLQKLRILNLDGTNITDSGLKYIINLKSLQYLDLSYTKVTDAGILMLAEMKNLRRVSVFKTKVTQKGVNKLQNIHPSLSIDLYGD
jgi:hypothetical protein